VTRDAEGEDSEDEDNKHAANQNGCADIASRGEDNYGEEPLVGHNADGSITHRGIRLRRQKPQRDRAVYAWDDPPWLTSTARIQVESLATNDVGNEAEQHRP